MSADTIAHYKKRKMKPFAPFDRKKGESRGYYEVPAEIVESPADLIEWARAAQRTPPLSLKTKPAKRTKGKSTPADTKEP